MEIQWYPGHMAKTRRELEEVLPLLDLIIEVADARIPSSSRNPDLAQALGVKPRLLLLNKRDLAEEAKNREWLEYYRSVGQKVFAFNGRTGEGMAELTAALTEIGRNLLKEKESFGRRRVQNRHLRLGVVGIPNVGKSSVLNRLTGRNAAQVGNRPGVTKGRQWVKRGLWEVLDTPGLLWPKFSHPEAGWLLAFTGAVKPEILDPEELALRLIRLLIDRYPLRLSGFYEIEEDAPPEEILENIGRRRGCLLKGGTVDWLRAANLVWTDFRTGRLGRFTLEDPPLSPLSP